MNALKRAVQMRRLRRQMEEQKVLLERYATQFEEMVETRTRDVLNTLEQRVKERTAELMAANEACNREIVERQQAEKALQESRHSLHAVVEAVPCLIVLTDPDGRLLQFNHTAEELTGYTREEVLGKRLRDLFIPSAWEPTFQPTQDNSLQSGSHAVQTTPWVTKAGDERLIEWRCAVFPYMQYEDPCVLGVGIDVTERQATESKIRRLNTELDQQVQAYAAVVRDLKASQAELQEKINDLEKFEEVVVGRELKMIALEKEIAALQRERDRLKAERERI
ncbi:MAG: PAS domain S-box protein [Nitrospiraceae bacterium]|nr:PAS domain S-box protein [Nitrospiraceae bacterium]